MPKTQATLDLENALAKQSKKMRIMGCFEVTIGWYGRERVDYLTLDFKDTWRCYEIKVSKSDFYSKSKKTFIGHLNYYVMPEKLYGQVKQDIPSHIGVKTADEYGNIQCIRQAKRQKLSVDEKILSSSMIRSLCREVNKKIEGDKYYE